jgi:hypothetical protein
MTDWLKPAPKEEDSIAVQMIHKNMKEWETLAADNNYEISTTFPYPIREKDEYFQQDTPNGEYRVYCFGGRMHYKHRLIAQQWLPNPDNLPQVHHKDGNGCNNHLSNLMWVSVKTNSCTKFRYRDREVVYLKELPEPVIEVPIYGKWQFNDLYYTGGKFYSYTSYTKLYRELPDLAIGYQRVTVATDVNGRQRVIYYSKFYRVYGIRNG